jgi:hypothetical protein
MSKQQKTFRRIDRELEQERKERQKAARRTATWSSGSRPKRPRHRLERAFERGGCDDPDYALALLERETTSMTLQEAEAWASMCDYARSYCDTRVGQLRVRVPLDYNESQ